MTATLAIDIHTLPDPWATAPGPRPTHSPGEYAPALGKPQRERTPSVIRVEVLATAITDYRQHVVGADQVPVAAVAVTLRRLATEMLPPYGPADRYRVEHFCTTWWSAVRHGGGIRLHLWQLGIDFRVMGVAPGIQAWRRPPRHCDFTEGW